MRPSQVAASATLIALILLGLAWELVLAPLKPGGSWLVLKIVPLLAILWPILHGRRKAYQGATMLVVFYAAEGATRAYTDGGLSARLGWVEVVIAVAFFAAAVSFVRETRAPTR